MRYRLAHFAVLVTVWSLAYAHLLAHAQIAVPSEATSAMANLECPPPISFHNARDAASQLSIADVTFERAVKLPVEAQNHIASDLKQQKYSGNVENVISGLEEQVRRAWQEHGYFNVQVHGDPRILEANSLGTHIAVVFQMDEGEQYRLGEITFSNNKAISNAHALRSLFAIDDGDVFDSDEVSKGLDRLRNAYWQYGYINSTSIPDTQIGRDEHTIWLNVDVDEGKQFFVSSFTVLGLDEYGSQDVLKRFLLKPGDIYNQRLVELSMKSLSSLKTGQVWQYRLYRDERAGTVAITVSAVQCPE